MEDKETSHGKVEDKETGQQRENEGYSKSSFQIPHNCTLFTEAQLIRTGLVLWSLK